jgi:hypothetical protein
VLLHAANAVKRVWARTAFASHAQNLAAAATARRLDDCARVGSGLLLMVAHAALDAMAMAHVVQKEEAAYLAEEAATALPKSTKKTEEAVANIHLNHILDSVYTARMDGLPFALPATNPDCAPSRVLPRVVICS